MILWFSENTLIVKGKWSDFLTSWILVYTPVVIMFSDQEQEKDIFYAVFENAQTQYFNGQWKKK